MIEGRGSSFDLMEDESSPLAVSDWENMDMVRSEATPGTPATTIAPEAMKITKPSHE